MQDCFYSTARKDSSILMTIVSPKQSRDFLKRQNQDIQDFAALSGFKHKQGQCFLLPVAPPFILGVMEEKSSAREWAKFAAALPCGHFHFEEEILDDAVILGWALAHYRFTQLRHNKKKAKIATLHIHNEEHIKKAIIQAEAIYLGRDLINMPANILTPSALAEHAHALSKQFGASYKVIEGEALIEENYPLIHAVGQAAKDAPRLIDMRWGESKNPLVILVGKGVCFDTGGLGLKPAKAMEIMQKDMGGAAHVLALAHMIMASDLPVCLHVLIPAVENSVSASAMRPGDIYPSRKGPTVEIGHTDAEGRLILADALYEASCRKPDFLIDFATLTGAARVATGPALPNLFSSNEEEGHQLVALSHSLDDPFWLMPLWQDYRVFLKGSFADFTNSPSFPYAGSITAALFLQEFLSDDFIKSGACWMHVDVMAWTTKVCSGFPKGGDIQGGRAVFEFLQQRYQNARIGKK
jgi:leucyl aminopeptidase